MDETLSPEQFAHQREELNALTLSYLTSVGKRFFSLDQQVYRSGALTAQTKELIALVASLVLRCDDCVRYHLIRCHQFNLSDPEVVEAMEIGLIVGGSIVIPHLRRAVAFWRELRKSLEPES